MIGVAEIFCRVLGALLILPFAHTYINLGKLFGVAFLLTLFFSPYADLNRELNYGALPKEFIIGLIIGLPAALTIDLIGSLGELFDNQRGVNFGGVYNPATGGSSSLTAHLMGSFATVLLLLSGIFESILIALDKSFLRISSAVKGDFNVSETSIRVIQYTAEVSGGFFKSFLICAVIFLLVDTASTFISKVLPQSSLIGEIFLVKSLIGTVVLLTILTYQWGGVLIQLSDPSAIQG